MEGSCYYRGRKSFPVFYYCICIHNNKRNFAKISNKFIDIFAGLGSTFYSITQYPSLLERTSSLGNIDKSIKNQIQTIDDCRNRQNEEKAGQ